MSGECDKCEEHCLDCKCIPSKKESQVGFLYAMPLGGTLEIRSSQPIEENIGTDEEVEGVFYRIYWNGVALPWSTKTLLQATAIAFGCQWGAQEMIRKFI